MFVDYMANEVELPIYYFETYSGFLMGHVVFRCHEEITSLFH